MMNLQMLCSSILNFCVTVWKKVPCLTVSHSSTPTYFLWFSFPWICFPPNVLFRLLSKPHAGLWTVSTNLNAVNKRVQESVVVNMSWVIIQWFYSLWSKAPTFKGNLKWEREKNIHWKNTNILEEGLRDLLWHSINACSVQTINTHCCSQSVFRRRHFHFTTYLCASL